MVEIKKNNSREMPTFANINLLGKCNVDCYFCLGKDLEHLLKEHNQSNIHFGDWKNFDKFLALCKVEGVTKLYLTGQNVDSLQYNYLWSLTKYVKANGFSIGLRSNGYLALEEKETIKQFDDEIGFSINSLNAWNNFQIMKRWDIPRWDKILTYVNDCRVSIVVNRYNIDEFYDIIKFCSLFPSVKYIQARRISTETRLELLQDDINLYEELYNEVKFKFRKIRDFYSAEIYDIYGKEVCFWRTVETSINSFNYFTDGTISNEYFIIDGYLKNCKKE